MTGYRCHACRWTGQRAHDAIVHTSTGYQHVTYLVLSEPLETPGTSESEVPE